MKKLKNAAVLTAGAAVLAGLAGFAGAGTAAADTASCSAALPAHTNGNPINDKIQQLNELFGDVVDAAKCNVNQFKQGTAGADDNAG
ncbi:hypothetical protein [Streptomyces sp. UNOC14_S4]|uniref:hypothetical protein n=1 Tax=Streptomyces sp. UNOC14_S4 TaxID=2872340 RepID=UPI001E5852FD|nr:hypothetical protein [Streptomyces sp. UNOC14_S4]MCC3767852.1 hypothetical protein [Streptomyces sp. UNOC14_S4]